MERIKGFLWGIMACILISILTGCKSVQFVPVETVKTDSVYIDRFQRDSIFLQDSVFVNRWTAGDTVYQDKVVWKYVYRDKVKYDTVAILRSDTVRVPYPVEKELGWWNKTRMYSFPLLVAIVAVLTFVVVWLAKKLRKK